MADQAVQEVKDRIDLVDLISSYVELKASGINHKGLCPFHQEKTASFMVNPERQIWRCFGCGEGGDAFSFLQKIESLTFPEALRILAEKAGVKLINRRTAGGGAKTDDRTELLDINQLASRFFRAALDSPTGQKARDYLSSRGLDRATIDRFQIGFAPRGNLGSRALIKKGLLESKLVLAGLVSRTGADRFQNRIIFPIKNAFGQIVGFTGRSLFENDPGPKYLNSPESPIFKKSRLLYGLFEGREATRKTRRIVLVEGQTDLLLSHQIGLKEAVATSGTALTGDHVRLLKRFADEVVLAFDNDDAGRKATRGALMLLLRAGLPTRLVSMPDGRDPADLISAGETAFLAAVSEAQPAVLVLIDQAVGGRKSLNPLEKRAIVSEIRPLILLTADPVEQAEYRKSLAERLLIDESAITRSAEGVKPATRVSAADQPRPPLRKINREELLLGLLILEGNLLQKLPIITFSDQKLTELFLALKESAGQVDRLPSQLRETLDQVAFLAEERYRGLDQKERAKEIQSLLRSIRDHRLFRRKTELSLAIHQAESQGNRQEKVRLLSELEALLRSGRGLERGRSI